MTTDPTFDELASAHLDGATTPEEAARVEADPALRARVDELRSVREAVAAVPPVDPERRDAAVAAAVAAFEAAPAERPARVVTPLRASTRRGGRSPAVRRALGAAAALVLLALLVPLLSRLGTTSSDDEASFDSTGAAIETAEDSAGDAVQGGADASPSTRTPERAVGHLGAFDDVDALVAALADADTTSAVAQALSRAEDQGAFDAGGCGPVTSGGETDGRIERARATVAGEDVIVVVHRRAEGDRTITVYRAGDCAVLEEVTR